MKKALAALAVIGALAYGNIECPIDNSMMMWTGKTRFEWGKMLKEYRCLMGHTSWMVE